jgi:hypothetical protein
LVAQFRELLSITSLGNSGTYDFIVMGTKGASGLKEVFIGSVAGGVIAKTKAPVLVVPGDYQYQNLNEIVFATSSEPLADPTVIEPLRQLTKLHASTINVLHISDDDKPDLEKVLHPIKDLNHTVTYARGDGNVNKRLKEHLLKEGAGLLCLIRRERGFFGRIFGESVTLKQTFSSYVPLLILRG